MDLSKSSKNKIKANNKKQNNSNLSSDKISQEGKSPQEMLPFHLTGESDDISTDFSKKLK